MLQTKLCVHWQLTLSPINKSAPLHPSHCPFIICQLSTGCQRTTSDILPFKLSACVESLSPPLVQKQVRGEKVTVRLKKKSIPWLRTVYQKHTLTAAAHGFRLPLACVREPRQLREPSWRQAEICLTAADRHIRCVCVQTSPTQSLKSLARSASIDRLSLLCDHNRFNIGNQ